MGFHGLRIERNRSRKILLGFLILVLSQENASQFGVGRGVFRMAFEHLAKNSGRLILPADGIIRKSQVIGSGHLIGLRFEALFERGFRFAVISFEVIDRANRIV